MERPIDDVLCHCLMDGPLHDAQHNLRGHRSCQIILIEDKGKNKVAVDRSSVELNFARILQALRTRGPSTTVGKAGGN